MKFSSSSGIALGPILFIIAILAVLAAAIAAGSGGFNADTNNESAKSLAQTIINQADQVSMAVQKVRMDNGCDDTQINFVNGIVSGYTNPNAPSDGSCNVFDPRGGGIIWQTPPPQINQQYDINGYNDTRAPANSPTGGAAEVNATFDIIMFLPFVPLKVCQQLNKLLFGSTQIPTSACINASAKFAGGFSWYCHYIVDGGTVNSTTFGDKVPAPMSACVLATGTWAAAPVSLAGNYFFYRDLVYR